eukprot:gene20507-40304_t
MQDMRRLPPLQSLVFFEAAVRHLSFTAAAQELGTSQPAVSQRIGLLGVKKEDLQAVWKDIGMPSGHAYAKALRTVKTCVGSEWCRMGTQD